MLTDQIHTALSAFRADPTKPLSGYLSPEQMTALQPSVPMLIGYSGGMDSSLLLFLAFLLQEKRGAPLYLCHLPHGIRGDEADRDADFAEEVAKAYGVKAFIVHRDIPRIAEESGESIEATARRVRYEVFASLMREHHIPILLTAHNADDTLETMLFHLMRGSGLPGLSGIPPVRSIGNGGLLLRPLLNTPRSDIEAFVRHYGIPYVEDSTNADTLYTRNRIRREVIPRLKEILPTAVSAAARSAALLREDRAYLEGEAARHLVAARDGDGLSVALVAPLDTPILSRVLLLYWKERLPTLDEYGEIHLREMISLVRSGKEGEARSLRKSTARIIKGRLCVDPVEEASPLPPLRTTLQYGQNFLPSRGICVTLTEKPASDRANSCTEAETNPNPKRNIYNSATQIDLCFDTISHMAFGEPVIEVRSRLPGDKILCRGMHRSLRTLCNEAKLSKAEREALLIFTLGNEIIWIPGLALRDKIACTDSARQILSITVFPSAE